MTIDKNLAYLFICNPPGTDVIPLANDVNYCAFDVKSYVPKLDLHSKLHYKCFKKKNFDSVIFLNIP